MFKKDTIKVLQQYADTARIQYEAGCIIAYNEALSQLANAFRKYGRFGKKYTLQGWQIVESK